MSRPGPFFRKEGFPLTTNEKIAALRAAAKAAGADGVILMTSDPHSGEYLPAHYCSLTHFSGFTGENATLVVTGSGSALWVDGRFYVQADKQLAGTEIQSMHAGAAGVPTVEAYLKANAGEGQTYLTDGSCMPTKVFEQYIASTGLSLEQAEAAGYQAVSTMITKMDRASYYPGGRDNQICLIFDRKTGRLLGAQGIGSESIAGRINVLATAITCGMTVEAVNELDLVYAPPVAPVYDPILIAASQAVKKVEKQVK